MAETWHHNHHPDEECGAHCPAREFDALRTALAASESSLAEVKAERDEAVNELQRAKFHADEFHQGDEDMETVVNAMWDAITRHRVRASAAESSLAEVRQEFEIATAEAVLWREREAAARAEAEAVAADLAWLTSVDGYGHELRRDRQAWRIALRAFNRIRALASSPGAPDPRDAVIQAAQALLAETRWSPVGAPHPENVKRLRDALRALAASSSTPATTPSKDGE